MTGRVATIPPTGSHFADPSFKPSFMLEPGQRIFTIGSCFARGIERTLAERGFDASFPGRAGRSRPGGNVAIR